MVRCLKLRYRLIAVFPRGAGWYDFYTGRLHQGGTSASVAAPADQMPLFVKAGSVVTMGPVTQYVDERPDAPIRLQVYAGANGVTSLYEDDGVTNAYARGEASRIPITYDDRTGVVTIGARVGKYKGMVEQRTFTLQLVRAGMSTSGNLDTAGTATVTYAGRPVSVKL